MKESFLLFLLSIYLFSCPPLIQASMQVEAESDAGKSPSAAKMPAAAVLTKEHIKIDGRLDEASWEKVLVITDFIQQNPDEGAPATERTEVKILYTEDSIYIGIRMYDSEPEKVKSILTRRDSSPPSDWIKIYIDGYHDHRTAFEFSVNPVGVKKDVYWTDDRRHDEDWDAVWDVGVSLDGEGWCAEFQIPFSQIRFPEQNYQTWGFQVNRVIARKNEVSYWRHVPKGVPRFVSLFGDLEGITGIPAPKRLQFLPYSLGKSSFQPAEDGNPFRTGSSYLANLGLDLKYGVSSNLTLDASFNPDFGQVEADPALVNLSAFESFFQEKRPFFMEGKNMLGFSIRSSRDGLFYSRRIGRAPQWDSSSAQYSQIPENTTILGAIRLTGKTAQGWSIGVMEALTGREQASVITLEGERTEKTVEPLTNYFLGKAEKEFKDGRSALALIFTAVNRRIEDESINFLHKAAYSGGFNFRNRWAKDTYEVSGFLIGSHVLGSEEAILRTQESSVHYFQRADAHHVEVDPTRTSLSGFAANFHFSKIGGGHWRWSVSGQLRSPGFEVNDMGYLRYANWMNHTIQIIYEEYKPGKVFRDYHISFNMRNSYDWTGINNVLSGTLRWRFRFLNYWNVSLNLTRLQEKPKPEYLRGGPHMLFPGSWRLRGSFGTDKRKDFFLSVNGNISATDDGAKSYSLSSRFTLRPSSNLELSFSPSFNDSCNMLQYVTQESSREKTHYILSRINRKTVSLTLRVNYTITPTLSLQLYTEPFVSAGDYSEFKEVVQPLAKNYSDRWHLFEGQQISLQDGSYHVFPPGTEGEEIIFSNPDFNFRQFRLNFVLRWEYLPGSTMFLIWTNSINDNAETGLFSLRNDLQNLFSSPSNNVFLFKISYWFDI